MDEIKKIVKDKVLKFIFDYQNSLGVGNIKSVEPVALITLFDLRYFLGFKDISYKEFKEIINGDDQLLDEVEEFLTNNFIHYSSSVKLKELLSDYKDSIVRFEPNNMIFDTSEIKTFVSNELKLDHAISLNCNESSDVDDEQAKRILETVETY